MTTLPFVPGAHAESPDGYGTPALDVPPVMFDAGNAVPTPGVALTVRSRAPDLSPIRVLTRLGWPELKPLSEGSTAVRVCVLTLQTTGLSASDDVFELYALPIVVDRQTGHLISIGESLGGFQELPVPRDFAPAITERTGWRVEDTAGHVLPFRGLNALLADQQMIVSFGAHFHREHATQDAVLPMLRGLVWGCLQNDVPWADQGFREKNLEGLLGTHARQFIPQPARLCSEVQSQAIVAVLNTPLPNGRFPMSYLFATCERPAFLLVLRATSYDDNAMLKARGYRFYPGNPMARIPITRARGWFRVVVGEDEAEAEKQWAADTFSGGVWPNARNIGRKLNCRQRHGGWWG